MTEAKMDRLVNEVISEAALPVRLARIEPGDFGKWALSFALPYTTRFLKVEIDRHFQNTVKAIKIEILFQLQSQLGH